MGTRIEATSALTSHGLRKATARRLADAAARTCLAHAGKEPGDIDMLINVGIYREDNMASPRSLPSSKGTSEPTWASRPSEGTAPSRSTFSTASAG
jgi:hypothetical protein